MIGQKLKKVADMISQDGHILYGMWMYYTEYKKLIVFSGGQKYLKI